MAIEPEQTTPPLQERQSAVPPELPGAGAPKHVQLFFLDNLRVLLIILVIAGHLAATYYGSDVWYYSEPTKDEVTLFILSSFGAMLQAFVIGLFFLIAGYLTPGAYDRKGAAAFLKGRVVRLGIPLLIYDLFINPLVIYVARGLPRPYGDFYSDYLLHFKQIGTGPVWFLEVLLLFSGGYMLWRWLASRRSRSTSSVRPFPASRTIVFFLLLLSVVTFVIRIWLPIFWLFEPLNLQLAFFAQYISLFIVGIMAYRQNWFLLIPDGMGKVWLWIAVGAMALFPFMTIAGGAFEHLEYFFGGLHWQAFVWTLWESVVGVGMWIGLLVFFRRHVNQQGKWGKAFAASAYTVYLIHGLVTVSLAYAARDIHLYPLLKFALAVLVAVPLCFVLGHLIHKLPLAHKIL